MSLDGNLDIQVDTTSDGLSSTYVPAVDGGSFTFLTASSIKGEFDSIAGRILGDDLQWILTYTDTALSLAVGALGSPDVDLRSAPSAVVPEPGTALLLALGLGMLATRRQRNR